MSGLTESIGTLKNGAPSERVEMLRDAALAKTVIHNNEPPLLWARSWMASGGERWFIVRRGRLCGDILRGLTPIIDPGELIVGKYHPRQLTEEEREELDNWNKYGSRAVPSTGGATSHMAIDYDKLLHLGIHGVKEEIANYRTYLNLDDPTDL